ncbi:hypothetical protein Tamer19_60690 [Cupriavidus sp. TA19]|nr:hypothetical protein Tamer19_60690 [Cupriavidus sp. TA19]
MFAKWFQSYQGQRGLPPTDGGPRKCAQVFEALPGQAEHWGVELRRRRLCAGGTGRLGKAPWLRRRAAHNTPKPSCINSLTRV